MYPSSIKRNGNFDEKRGVTIFVKHRFVLFLINTPKRECFYNDMHKLSVLEWRITMRNALEFIKKSYCIRYTCMYIIFR